MKSPFKFLDSFSRSDADSFFGRDKETEEVYNKLFSSNLLLVYGASGTGKTSLINCGVSAKFEESDWFPLIVRRKSHIIDSLIAEIKKAAITPLDEEESISGTIQSLYLDYFKPIYIIFDQFEELFISGTSDEQLLFIETLQGLLHKQQNLKIIIIVREEYLAYFSEYEKSIKGFFDNRVRVEHMTQYNMERVISNMCAVKRIDLENEKIPGEILKRISSKQNLAELTHLQVYLDRLFNYFINSGRDPSNIIFDHNLIAAVGNIDDVLGLFLEEQINKMENPDIAWHILKAFVTGGGTKRTTSLKMISDYLAETDVKISSDQIKDYTNQFLNLKIIRYIDE